MMRAVDREKHGRKKAPPGSRTEPDRAPAPDARVEGPRGRLIVGAARLLARRGLQATSFSEVLEATGSPRGSLYHHFPDGKDQLVKAALDLVAGQMAGVLDPREGAPAEEITDLFLRVWRSVLTRSSLQAGCAVVAVTVAADSHELLEHAATIFRAWRLRLAALLVKGGLPPAEAGPFAALLIAASEGAVILCRAEQSLEPFDLVAAQLLERVQRRRGRTS
jgi:TetR/AcrR family transcriptional repressor of lmrAB and yxaGH operons